MPIRTILLPLRESDMSEHMLESGLLAAQRFDAHLDVFFVHPRPEDLLPYATLGLSGSMRERVIDSARQSSVQQAQRLQSLFEQIRARVGVERKARGASPGTPTADWIEVNGVRSVQVARFGRLADLILTPRPERADPPPKTFEAITRETGRPVLLVPRGTSASGISPQVAIGWNGSAEAAHAVAASRPVLRAAERVCVIVSSKRQQQRPNADDVVNYLECHGVNAEASVVDMSGKDVGRTLLDECSRLGAGLLVVGGYSSTRLQELLLGGVTRYLIREAHIPVLMVH